MCVGGGGVGCARDLRFITPITRDTLVVLGGGAGDGDGEARECRRRIGVAPPVPTTFLATGS